MENKSFDDIIKSKLAAYSQEKTPAAWEVFQQSMEDSGFDDGIRENVESYQEDLPLEAWAIFSERIGDINFDSQLRETLSNFDSGEVPADFDLIRDKTTSGFDALIGAKLAAASVDNGSDWENFSKLLDSDVDFDTDVKDKIRGHEAPLSESQWPKLSEHLEKLERRRRRIVITKFIEAAVFILFILTIMQLYPINNFTKENVYRTHGVAEGINKQKIESEMPASEIAEVVEQEVSDIIVSASDAASSEIVILSNDGAVGVSQDEVLESNSKFERSVFLAMLPLETRIHEVQVADDHLINLEKEDGTERTEVLVAGIKNKSLEVLDFERARVRLNVDKDEDLSGQVFSLASLDLEPLEARNRDFNISNLNLLSKLKDGQYWFNVYGSPQINMINTPYDRSYSDNRSIDNEEGAIEAYSNVADGYTIGASISKESANYEIEGGVEFTSLNYRPRQVTERVSNASSGYKEFLLKEIIFDIIEIPVNIKYNLFKKKGWRVYGNNGISVGTVAFATYDIEENNFKPLASSIAGQSPRNNEESFVDRKKFLPGFFRDQEDFLENTFVTVSAGMGVSKKISDKISFYVQPTYYHNLSQSGIGPNNDVHHRLSMQIGTKVRL